LDRQAFIFWQFNGDNSSVCNFRCDKYYCYGGVKRQRHDWNNQPEKWEKAFERLNRDIYFVFSYGESMIGKGFYECVDMIGRHENWELCIVTNLSQNPQRLIESKLGRDKRVYITACWHPLGVPDRTKEEWWKIFTNHLLLLQKADIKTLVLYLWYPLQIKWYPEYFDWLDKHNIRTHVRRYVPSVPRPLHVKLLHPQLWKNKTYSNAEWQYLLTISTPKSIKYGLKLVSPMGRSCSASKDMILVKCDGTVALCADAENYYLGNIFDPNFKLATENIRCPARICGGDYGLLHMVDDEFGPLPDRLWHDNFVCQVEDLHEGVPVPYRKKEEMLFWLGKLRY
jgi:hypothetical protein